MRLYFLAMMVISSLWGETLFEEATKLYARGEYNKAFALFERLATEERDEDAAYYLGVMYENGEGVEADPKRADEWYKTAATRYYSAAGDKKYHTLRKEYRKFYRSLDALDDYETEKTVRDAVESLFGLRPYHENYLLPFAYSEKSYTSYAPSDNYTNIEVEMQLSVKYDFYANLFGLNEIYTAAYTQKSWWQLYSPSSPFRESNYNPEVFVGIPMYGKTDAINLKRVAIGFAHQSNGQGNISLNDINTTGLDPEQLQWLQNRSRSWNYLWSAAVFQTSALFTELKFWWRIPEKKDDDNPDLSDYLGYGYIKLRYPYGKSLSSLMLRHNFRTGRGAQEFSCSYPIYGRDDIFWYVKAFTGYGESLIDYNRYVNKFSFGFSFSR